MSRVWQVTTGVLWRTAVTAGALVSTLAIAYVTAAAVDTYRRAKARKAQGLPLKGHLPRAPPVVRLSALAMIGCSQRS